jgi:hypothetical protein
VKKYIEQLKRIGCSERHKARGSSETEKDRKDNTSRNCFVSQKLVPGLDINVQTKRKRKKENPHNPYLTTNPKSFQNGSYT